MQHDVPVPVPVSVSMSDTATSVSPVHDLLVWLSSTVDERAEAPFLRGRDLGAGATCTVTEAYANTNTNTNTSSSARAPARTPLCMPSGAVAAVKWTPLSENRIFVALSPDELCRAPPPVCTALCKGSTRTAGTRVFSTYSAARRFARTLERPFPTFPTRVTRAAVRAAGVLADAAPVDADVDAGGAGTGADADAAGETDTDKDKDKADKKTWCKSAVSVAWLMDVCERGREGAKESNETSTEALTETSTQTLTFLQLTQFWCEAAVSCLVSEFVAPFCLHVLQSSARTLLVARPPASTLAPASASASASAAVACAYNLRSKAKGKGKGKGKTKGGKSRGKGKAKAKATKGKGQSQGQGQGQSHEPAPSPSPSPSSSPAPAPAPASASALRRPEWIGVTLMERAHCTLEDILPEMTVEDVRVVTFQVLVALHTAQTRVGLKHHDLHAENVFCMLTDPAAWMSRVSRKSLLRKLRAQELDAHKHAAPTSALPEAFEYVLGGRRFRVPHRGVIAKIGDYDQASAHHPRIGPSARVMRADLELLNLDEVDDDGNLIWGPWDGRLVGQRGYDAQYFVGFLLTHESITLSEAVLRFLRCVLRKLGGELSITETGRPVVGAVSDVPPLALLHDADLFGDFCLDAKDACASACAPAPASSAERAAGVAYADEGVDSVSFTI